MVALQIKEVKNFMGQLLATPLLDSFLVQEGVIHTYNSFWIDGRINADFFTKEELEEEVYDFSTWEKLRPICFELVKGKKTPTLLKLVLQQKPEDSYSLLEQGGCSGLNTALKGLLVTIKFDQNGLVLTTGTSFSTFIMDKTPDLLWDQWMKQFLTEKGIGWEEL